MKLSVAATLYRSEPYFAEFHRQVGMPARAPAGDDYETVPWSGVVCSTVFNWLTKIEHRRHIATARLMKRRYVVALLSYREREVVISC
jgi:hypothetical protein